jgi:hypothetical protein
MKSNFQAPLESGEINSASVEAAEKLERAISAVREAPFHRVQKDLVKTSADTSVIPRKKAADATPTSIWGQLVHGSEKEIERQRDAIR